MKRKGSVSTDDNKPAMLPPAACENQSIELPKLLTIEGLQEESGGEETMSHKDGDDQLEDAVYVESKSDGNVFLKFLIVSTTKLIKLSESFQHYLLGGVFSSLSVSESSFV